MPITAAQIAEQLRGEVLGDGSVQLTGFAPADCARPGDLTFAEKETHFAAAEESQAAAILVAETFAPSKKVLIRVRNARVAMARVLVLSEGRTIVYAFPNLERNHWVQHHSSFRVTSSLSISFTTIAGFPGVYGHPEAAKLTSRGCTFSTPWARNGIASSDGEIWSARRAWDMSRKPSRRKSLRACGEGTPSDTRATRRPATRTCATPNLLSDC